MFKGFRSSLVDVALQWYTNISNFSIGSFNDLHSVFLEQFASSCKIEEHLDDLYAIKQRESESL